MNQRVLVVADVVGARNGDGWFVAEDVEEMFEALRVPPPASVARSIGQMIRADLVRIDRGGARWSLTPAGRRRAMEAIGEIDYAAIAAELANQPGANFAHTRHVVIPPTMAPNRWAVGIQRMLERFPFETNVFCMTRFPVDEDDVDLLDPVAAVIETLRTVAQSHGLMLHVASDRLFDDDLLGNVGAYMWACQYGIGLLETRDPSRPTLNDNMLIELGSMLTIGRRCAILKDQGAPSPPTDLSGQIYKSVDFDDQATVSAAAHLWFAEDLGLGRCPTCP